MEKRNVVEEDRTPEDELSRPDDDWDKTAADIFDAVDATVEDIRSMKMPVTDNSKE